MQTVCEVRIEIDWIIEWINEVNYAYINSLKFYHRHQISSPNEKDNRQ